MREKEFAWNSCKLACVIPIGTCLIVVVVRVIV